MFDTGDTIFHAPSSEFWGVAYNDGTYICCIGWPCSLAPLKDCSLVKKAKLGDKLTILIDMAKMDGSDPRRNYAVNRLRSLDWLLLEIRELEAKITKAWLLAEGQRIEGCLGAQSLASTIIDLLM